MNKIYKLIWSQSRNGWVVASELAKGHGKNTSSRRRRALITLAAAVLLGSAFLPAEPISAEDPAAGGALPYVSIGTNASHKIKVRRDVKDPSSDKIITIEDESELDLESNKKPLGNPSYNAILIGPEAKTGIGNGSESINGVVAIGFKTTALKQYTTAVGTNAFAGSAGDVALGWKSYTSDYILNPEETRSNKIAIGTESTAKAANGIAIGTQSKIDEYSDNAIAIGRGAEVGLGETSTDSTAIGHEVKVYGTYGVAIGSKATAGTKKDPGGEYVVIGNQSHVYDTNGVVIGAQSSAKENAVVLGSHAEGAMGSVAVGGQTKADTYALAAGQGSKAGEYAVAMGSSAEATEENSIAIGREVTATKERAIAIGRSANAAGSRSLAIGDSAQVTGGGAEDYLSIAVGSQAVVNKKAGTALGAITAVYGEGGTALGRGAFAGSDYATGVGYNAIANSASTVAIGANTRADIEDGIALGSGSQVNEDWGNGKAGMYGYDPDVGGYSNDESSTWKSTRSAVSVGDPEQKITRQIINVAAGMRDTDVVNVAQLKKLKARTAADLKKEKEALDKRITSNAGNINKLSNKVSQHTTDIFGLKQKQKKDFEALNTKIENSTVRFVSVNKEDTDEYTDNYLNDGAKKAGAVAIGVNANAGGEDAVALGPSAYAIGSGSVAIGAGAAQQGGDPEQKKGQFEAGIIVGRDNMVSVEASETGGREDTVIGRLNYVSDSHGAFVRGIGNAVFDAYNDEVLTEDDQQQEERFIIKSEHDNSGLFEKGRSHVAVDGDANSVVGSLYTRVSGVANKLSNEDGQPRMSYNIVTGNRNELTDANRNLILGDNHELEKVNGNIIIGSAKTKQKTAASEVAILGNDANVSVDGGVALGSGSVAGTGAGVAGWDPKTEQTSKETGAAWKSGNGAVSVGAADKTRQITNLAAGTEDTDAVNVAQLKSVKGEVKANAESIGRLQGGFTVKDAGKGTADVALGDTARQAVTFKAAVDDKSSAASSLTAAVDADRNVTYTLNTNQLKKDLGITEAGVGTMSSWQLGVAGDKNIEEIKDGGGVSFAADGKGLTVAREGATITYTIDGSQIDISGNTSITNLNQKIDDASLHYVSIKRTNQSPAPESNYLNDGAKGDGGMAIGEFATSQGRGIAMGYKSRAVPKAGATLGISSFEGIAVGQEANTEVSGGIAIGLRSKVEGTLNTKEGNVNEQGTVALGVDAYAKGNGAAAFGWKARGDGEGAMAFGTETKAAESGTAFGAHSVAAAGGIAMGWQAHANDLVAVSVGTSSDAAKQATAVGAGTTADGIASLAVGVGAVSKGVLSASVGAKSVAEAENSVALGAETVANREAGKVGYIATGGSATFEEALTTLNKKEDYDKWTATVNAAKAEYDTLTKAFNDAADKNKKAEAKQALDNWKGQHADFVEALTAKERLEATWKSTKAAVSVGADSVDAAGNRVIATRQITNLAAGTEDTDAVNVAQLKSVADKASEAADGAKKHTTVVAGDYVTVTEGTNAAGGKEYTVAGPVIKTDSNLTISDIKEGSKKTGYTLGLSRTISVDTVKAGEGVAVGDTVTLGKEGLAIKDGPSVKKDGIDAGNKKITNVADGENDTDAVNYKQLNKLKQDVEKNKVTVEAKKGSQITVTGEAQPDHSTKYVVDITKDGTVGGAKDGNLVTGAVVKAYVDANKTTVTGDKAGGVIVENIAEPGKPANYKVSLGDTIKAGDVTVDGTKGKGQITGLSNTAWDGKTIVTGRAATEDQLKSVADKASEAADGAKKHTTVVAGDYVTVTEGTNAAGGKEYTVAGPVIKTDSNLTISDIKEGSKKTGYTLGLSRTISVDTVKAGEGVAVGDTVTLGKEGLAIKDGPSVKKDGIDAGNKKITNVADGENDTDAVNYKQLKEVVNGGGQAVSILGNKVSALGNRVNRVGAGAAALAALHPLDFDPDDKWDFAAGYGRYKGANAAAVGAYYRPNEDTMISVGGSFGGGENMMNAGVSLKLGQGNHVTTSRVAMAKEIKDLRAEVEMLRSAIAGIGEGQAPDPVKMKLFPDVAKNHWAYEAVGELAKQGLLEGYPDGTFGGDRMMTRYEFAALVYRAVQKGLNVNEKLISEFEPELERFRIDVISRDKAGNPAIERVRVNQKAEPANA